MNKATFRFIILLIIKHKSKHISIFIISTLFLTLLSSILFISSSLKSDELKIIDEQFDFVIQKEYGGNIVNTPISWVDQLLDIDGIGESVARVYGRYVDKVSSKVFLIIGVDIYEKSISKYLEQIPNNMVELNTNEMVVSPNIATFLKHNYYNNTFTFYTPTNQPIELKNIATLSKSTNILSANMIIVDIDTARTILGISKLESTDIVINIPNQLEQDFIKNLLILNYNSINIITKDDIKKSIIGFYNLKSGIFIILLLISIFTFALILFQRYSMINSSDKIEIGILRSVGWSIQEVMVLKLFESLIVATFAMMSAFLLSYFYVFYLNAPLLIQIFKFGANNPFLTPTINISELVSIGIFFIIPYILSILIPTYKLSIIEPSEVLR